MGFLTYSTTAEAQAARVRAVLAYAALSADQLASRMQGVSVATIRRIAAVSNPRGASLDELWAIADAAQVPRDWLVADWGKKPGVTEDAFEMEEMRFGVGDPEQRLDALEQGMRALLLAEQRRQSELAPTARRRRRAAGDAA